MAILESNAIHSSYQRLSYLFNEPAHNVAKTDQRVLACGGINIHMLHDSNGNLTPQQNGAYLEKQFRQNLKLAFNPKRQYQAQSIIISCSSQEFNTSNLDQQARQLLQLTNGFANKYFGDCQVVIAIQADGGQGQSGKLHAHLLINAVKPRHGTTKRTQTVPTSRFSVNHLRNRLDDYLENHFERVTGRQWPGPINSHYSRQDLDKLPTKASWQKELKQVINEVKQQVTTVKDFLSKLNQHGITVTERGKQKQWTYHLMVNTKHGSKERRIRAFYQRKDKKSGQVIATRGLGTNYTRQGLEKYWQKQSAFLKQHESQDEYTHQHKFKKRKEASTDEESKSQSEQLEKLKTIARDAKARANQQQLARSINLRQLRAEEAKESKQGAKRQGRPNPSRGSNKRRSPSISKQRRANEAAARRIEAVKRRKSNNHEKDAGPDF